MSLLLATQTRGLFGGVGLGELAGLAFMLMCVGQPGRTPGWVYWLIAVFFTGFVVGVAANQFHGASSQLAVRDLGALIFALSFAVCTILHLQQCERPGMALAQGMAAAVFVQVIPLALLLGGIETGAWLTDSEQPGIPFLSRYIGFSDNPNQLGVLLCAYPFLIGHATVQARGWWRLPWLLALVVGLAMAVLIQSNTVFAAYILCTAMAVILFVNRWHRGPSAGVSLWGLSAALLLALLAAAAFVLYANESVSKTGDADANGRFQLWQNGMQGVIESGGLGVGPGGQSGETAPFQGHEAHNLLLDITLQGGALSLLAYLALVLAALVVAWRQRSLVAMCILLAILTQQIAHYTARQPMAWVYLLLPFALLLPRQAAGRQLT